MPSRVLAKIRALVRSRQYVMTVHAEEQMEEDGFSILDVENALLTGRIIGRQSEPQSKERKYVIEGRSADNIAALVVVVKFGLGGPLIIVTVHGS